MDIDSDPAFAPVWTALTDRPTVVACDMRRLTFLDPAGLQLLHGFAARLEGHGIAFFAYNWQRQPMRLLDLIDRITPTHASDRSTPTGPLRRTLPGSLYASSRPASPGRRPPARSCRPVKAVAGTRGRGYRRARCSRTGSASSA
ncbi:STAS domain-containing protein [Streptomyces erythrochromogenes]|uniref:STAS domain-containing protein n=1 Tax=Streptomyces erythrochromogenes TaxID=285574 RepID=UPI003696A9EB